MSSLATLKPGQSAEVTGIDTTDMRRLMKLVDLGLAPGARVRLQQRSPTYIIWVDETRLSLEEEIAREILIDAL